MARVPHVNTTHTERPSVRVRDIFFDEAHIERTAEICVRCLSDYIDDPLTVFGNIAIRSPVSCTLTQNGLLPFAGDLRIVIPFSSMTVAQLQVVRSISCALHTADSIRYKHLDGTLSLSCPRDTDKVLIDAALVLFAINALILRAVEGHSINPTTVINVTQQRVLASIHVHRSQLARADSLTRAHIAARASNNPLTHPPQSPL
jgi:hypothetical protein